VTAVTGPKVHEKKREWSELPGRNAAESKALQEKLKKQRDKLNDYFRRGRGASARAGKRSVPTDMCAGTMLRIFARPMN
jgi:hypothetical protein